MELGCEDVGVNCDFEMKCASPEEEVMQIAAAHTKMVLRLDKIPRDGVRGAEA